MSEDNNNGADVKLELGGQKIALRNVKSLNTILTLVAAIAASFGVYLLIQHQAEAKEAGTNFVGALKEQTRAIQEQTAVQREGNCLMVIKDPEHCRRITGVSPR
jgi:uncharacterized protein HemX